MQSHKVRLTSNIVKLIPAVQSNGQNQFKQMQSASARRTACQLGRDSRCDRISNLVSLHQGHLSPILWISSSQQWSIQTSQGCLKGDCLYTRLQLYSMLRSFLWCNLRHLALTAIMDLLVSFPAESISAFARVSDLQVNSRCCSLTVPL